MSVASDVPDVTRGIVSRLDADGHIVALVSELPLAAPGPDEVVIAVEAAPVNPSDLGLLFGPADVSAAEYGPGTVRVPVAPGGMRALAGRVGQALPVGNEGAGLVIAAGSGAAAQALVGQRVACFAGGMYAAHRVVPAAQCLPLPAECSARDGAGAFVNPLTALAFVETMRAEGHTALVHTAAASNLGQMLVRICAADGVGLVNVVRGAANVALLRGLGAEHVVDSDADSFRTDLVAAIAATGATMAFDAVGGGPLLAQILGAMEQVASANAAYTRYGSDSPKRGFIYGALDPSPTVLNRTFGFVWDISGWLLMPMRARLGRDACARMDARVRAELTTTFASHYKAEVGLEAALAEPAVRDYTRKATGAKYLIVPPAG